MFQSLAFSFFVHEECRSEIHFQIHEKCVILESKERNLDSHNVQINLFDCFDTILKKLLAFSPISWLKDSVKNTAKYMFL